MPSPIDLFCCGSFSTSLLGEVLIPTTCDGLGSMYSSYHFCAFDFSADGIYVATHDKEEK